MMLQAGICLLLLAVTAVVAQSTCEFRCGNGRGRGGRGSCVPKAYVCDGDSDCPDGSDERGCDRAKCQSVGKFKCAGSSRCVPQSLVCDGDKNCPAGDDEMNCGQQSGALAAQSNVTRSVGEFAEYIRFKMLEMARQKALEEQQLREAFEVVDKEGDGGIGADELRTLLQALGVKEEKMDEAFQKFYDKNADGKIDEGEFPELVKALVIKVGEQPQAAGT